MITARLLRAADVTVTGVDIDELDAALTTGPQHGRDIAQAAARIEFTAAGTAEPRHLPVRIGYALALAAATGAPVRVADQLMDQRAVPAQDDLVDQFTRDVPLPASSGLLAVPREPVAPAAELNCPCARQTRSQAGYWSWRPHTSIHSSSVSLRPAERMSASSWKYSSRGGPGANRMSIRATAPLSLEKA